jgi:putative hydrolase of the HAD superfamily
MYKFLIFDADHTLFDFDRAEENAIKMVLGDLGRSFNYTELLEYKRINSSLWRKFELNEISQGDIKYERFRLFFESIGVEADFKNYASKYLEYLSQGVYLIPGAVDLIKSLQPKFKLGLLTNGIPAVQHPRLENSELSGKFDAVVVSGDVGISKPNPGIFEILAEKACFYEKNTMLMIGDSLTSDIKGGLNFGIDTCWYNPAKKPNDTTIIPKFVISNLNELYSIIGEGGEI